jgi:pilus assembly protein CpaB
LKSRYIILISIVFGLLTGYLIFNYLTGVEQAMTNIEYGEVVVAARDLPAKTLLTKEMVEIKKVPRDYIHPQALTKEDEAAGTINTTALVMGEQVLKSKVATKDNVKNGLSYLVPVGKRAVTVAVDDVSGVAGLIRPGDRIDVAAAVNIPEGQREQPFALVVLQNIQVLAVGKNMEAKETQDSKTVTLAVTVEESRPLILASSKGSIRLMLRSPADNGTVYTAPFKAENFMQ